MIKYLIVFVGFILLGGCSEDTSCDCVTEEIEFMNLMYAHDRIIAGPVLQSKACKKMKIIDSNVPEVEWIDFVEKIKDCPRFEEYIELRHERMKELEEQF